MIEYRAFTLDIHPNFTATIDDSMLPTNIPIHRPTSSLQRNSSATLINTSQKLDSISEEWDRAIGGKSTITSTTDNILAQSLPPNLAVPSGWHSEIVGSSAETGVTSTQDVYQTTNSYDSSSYAYASSDEVSTVFPTTTTTTTSNVVQDQQVFRTQDDQAQLIRNVETDQTPPVVLHRTIPNNKVTYQQNVSVRYLQPPTPPPPGPIIIREVRPPPPKAPTPIQIRQRPPPPPTPPPIVIREHPPEPPPVLPSQVVEKVLPPPPAPPRRMIVERFASCPPKPPDMVIERWLPYRRSERRRILYERAPAPYIPPSEPNLLVLHDQPRARIEKEFINQGVVRVDPETYLQRYGAEIHSGYSHSQYSYIADEAARTVPPPIPMPISSRVYSSSPYPSHYSHSWDRTRSVSPVISYPSSYYDRYDDRYRSMSRYASDSYYPYDDRYRSMSRYASDAYYPYDDYRRRSPFLPTMVDVTSSWRHHCRSPYPSHSYLPSYNSRSIRVNSDRELRDVLADLTGGRPPSPYRSY